MKDKLFSLRNLWRRIVGETPSFFRKLRALCVTIATAGGLAELWISQHPDFHLPAFVETGMSYVALCSLFVALTASLPVADNSKAVKP